MTAFVLAWAVTVPAVDPSFRLLPYWNLTLAFAPRGVTDPSRVAVPNESLLAEPVRTVGPSSSETLPIAFAPRSVNQRLPSGPVVRSSRLAFRSGTGNSLIVPSGFTRPIALVTPLSRNHRLPSGPTVIALGAELGLSPAWYSVT